MPAPGLFPLGSRFCNFICAMRCTSGITFGCENVPLTRIGIVRNWPVSMETWYLTALLQSVHYDFREVLPVYASHGVKVADETIYAEQEVRDKDRLPYVLHRISQLRFVIGCVAPAGFGDDGEMIETRLESSEDVTFDDYLKVIEYKTATAFEAASKIGAILGGGTEEQILALAEYGKN